MLIKIRIILTIFVLLFILPLTSHAVSAPEISAASAVLIDGDTLEILYEKEAQKKRSMASTTKIMTSLLAVESKRLNETVRVKEKIYIEGTAIGFNKGDELTLETLCYAMLLESGNDAAVLTAQFLAGNEEKFSQLMNNKAAEIGMKNSNFVTASGLDDEKHYTTAYDMALLGANAVKNTKFRQICSCKNYKAEFIAPKVTRYFSNHNKLLSSCEGVFGLKTGFTKKSGRCLVSACERNGKILVAVTLNAPNDWNDHKKLYEYGYSLYQKQDIRTDIPLICTVFGGEKAEISLKNVKTDEFMVLKNSKIGYKILLNKIQYAPIERNDVVGKIQIFQNGIKLTQAEIISCDNCEATKNAAIKKQSFFQRMKLNIKNLFKRKVDNYDRR